MIINLERDCEPFFISEEEVIENFDCGDEDLKVNLKID